MHAPFIKYIMQQLNKKVKRKEQVHKKKEQWRIRLSLHYLLSV